MHAERPTTEQKQTLQSGEADKIMKSHTQKIGGVMLLTQRL